jgi:hypothetical protein
MERHGILLLVYLHIFCLEYVKDLYGHIRILIGFLGEHPKILSEDGGDRYAPCRGANGTGFG